METGERIPDEPSELALSYSARLVAHESPLDVPEEDLMKLTSWEARILGRTALKNGYTIHQCEREHKCWLTRS